MPIFTEFKLHPSHGLIHVQNPGIMTFFEDWTQQEIDQGFAWVPDGVSFKLLTDHSKVNIGIAIEDTFVPLKEAIRVICVPFDVSASGSIVVSELFQSYFRMLWLQFHRGNMHYTSKLVIPVFSTLPGRLSLSIPGVA